MFSRRHPLAGQAFVPVVLSSLLIVLLVLLTIPSVEHQRHQLARKQCIENLALIAAAKESLAVTKNLTTGMTVAMNELVKDGRVITEAPLFPSEANVKINPIGTMPSCVYGGETLTPLIDNRPTPNFEINTP